MLNREVIAYLPDDIFQHIALQNPLPDVHRHPGRDVINNRHRRGQPAVEVAVNGVQRSHIDQNDQSGGQRVTLDPGHHLVSDSLRRHVERHIE